MVEDQLVKKGKLPKPYPPVSPLPWLGKVTYTIHFVAEHASVPFIWFERDR